MNPYKRSFFALALVSLCFAFAAFAQTNRATLTGTVTDQSGAVIPGADVTVTNIDTGQERKAITSDAGVYVVTELLPGKYRVTVELSGFARAVRENITLQTADRAVADMQLRPAGTTETVTVTSDLPLVQTESSERGEVVTGRQVSELPLNGRNFSQLATLGPGVSRAYIGVQTDASAFNNGDPRAGGAPNSDPNGSTEAARFSRTGGASISANGLRPTNNNFSLDGVDNNEPQFNTIGVFPNPDAIQEFKVETNVPRAEVGRAGGAVINTTFKSGTNDFHGSGYYYGQNTALNAANTFLKRQNLPPADTKPVQQFHEFGGTIGGPIWKEHTFFFFDYLGQRNNTGHPFSTTVPTAKSRNGDFSEFKNPVTDPLTGKAFPGNIIPSIQSRPDFSKPAFNFLNAYPLPNRPILNPGDGKDDPSQANYFSTRRNHELINNYDIKIDHKIAENNQLMGRFSFANQERDRASYFQKLPSGFGAGNELGNTRQVVVSDVHTFTPAFVNDFRFGMTKIEISIINAGVGGVQGISPTISKDLGIPNTNKGTFETTGSFLTGGFGNGFTEFAGDGGPFIVRSTNLYFADSVTVVKASHTLKAGTEIRPRFLETIDGGRSGFLKGALNYGDNNTGNAQGDMLLGTFAPQAQSGTVPGGLYHPRQQEYGFFVQDDWKVSPKLMLNLGLRYDLFAPPTEKDGRFGNFDPNLGRVIVAGGKGDSLVSTDKNNWGPRAGFAYGINKDMVVRGGYALLYTVEGNEYPPLLRNVPFTNQVFYNNFGGAPSTFSFTTGPPVAPIGDPARVSTDFAVYSVETHTTTPGIQQWNLTYQWGFARDYSFDIGYVATRGKHLLATRNLGNQGQGLGLARNFEGKVFDTDKIYENRASSHYDSMQIQVQKRESHGLIGSVAYTWSHNIDESTGEFGGLGDFRGSSGGPIDPFCFRCERGNSSLDVRHLMAARLLYDLPFGRGRTFELSGPVDKIFGGWQTNFIFTARTGFPFTVSYHDATTDLDTRPDQIGDPFQSVPAGLFLNPKAFGPAKRTVTNLAGKKLAIGNVGRNTFTGPGYFRTDFSVLKKTKLTEAAEMHFGMEFFNLFNQVHVLTPNSGIDLNNPNNGFGKFFYALPPRTMQYRLKFVF